MTENPRAQAQLVSALRDAAMANVNERVALIETHISYVLLTGRVAYKIKKAVNLGFLDFRSLEARRHYCEEELRLNRRFAPKVYLDVVPITGSIEAPVIGGEGAIIEYAVKMREFAQDALASRLLVRGALTVTDVDALAVKVAAAHASAGVVAGDGPFGAPGNVLAVALRNFTETRPLLESEAEHADLDALARWAKCEYACRAAAMLRRRDLGFVRECHGDLHLGNIACVDGELTIFDCIEFDEEMRWIDVMSEVAFTVMDLRNRGRPDFAHRFLNAYLEITGDYDGLCVLRFYLVYRALVRAKITRLRAAQLTVGEAKTAVLAQYGGYLTLAKSYTEPPTPAIVITHGLSGAGKTTLSQALLEQTGAVRIRTDIERKRTSRVDPHARAGARIDSGLYAPEATRETYARVLELTRSAIVAGFAVIVDAAFIKRWQRHEFKSLATELGVPFVIASFVASEAKLRERIARRQRVGNDASDADLAVLEHQLRTQEPLSSDEQADVVTCDTNAALPEAGGPPRWQAIIERTGIRMEGRVT